MEGTLPIPKNGYQVVSAGSPDIVVCLEPTDTPSETETKPPKEELTKLTPTQIGLRVVGGLVIPGGFAGALLTGFLPVKLDFSSGGMIITLIVGVIFSVLVMAVGVAACGVSCIPNDKETSSTSKK